VIKQFNDCLKIGALINVLSLDVKHFLKQLRKNKDK